MSRYLLRLFFYSSRLVWQKLFRFYITSSVGSSNLFRLISDKRNSLLRLYSFKGTGTLSGKNGRGASSNSYTHTKTKEHIIVEKDNWGVKNCFEL